MRDINLLFPRVREKALKLQKLALDKLGLKIIFTQTLRTAEEQKALYAQGRQLLQETNRLRNLAGLGPITEKENKLIVTKASKIEDSFHAYGLAFDIAVTSKDGKSIDWSTKSDQNSNNLNDWNEVGKLASEVGLEWGGNWSGMADPPHFQDRCGLTLAELKSGKRPV